MYPLFRLRFCLLYLMPYILSTYSVLTPSSSGAAFHAAQVHPDELKLLQKMFQRSWQAPFAPRVLPSQSLYVMISGFMLETLQTESWVLVISL